MLNKIVYWTVFLVTLPLSFIYSLGWRLVIIAAAYLSLYLLALFAFDWLRVYWPGVALTLGFCFALEASARLCGLLLDKVIGPAPRRPAL